MSKKGEKTMSIKCKLQDGAKLPTPGSKGAAGADLTALSVNFRQERNGPVWEYETGVAVEIPEGYVGLLFPRSGITIKTTLTLGNGVGVIDSDYRGTIKCQFRNTNGFLTTKYEVGDRVAQLVVLPIMAPIYEQVEELSDTNRGDGSFGSTGK
jgi:dUTP pyrophosphatase